MEYLKLSVLIVVIIFVAYVSSILISRETFQVYDEKSPYVNFNLTNKPVANHSPYPMYVWWKYLQNNDKYNGCDQYRCGKPFTSEKESGSPVGFDLTNGKYSDPNINNSQFRLQNPVKQCAYYENSTNYCLHFPKDDRCPNNWIKH